MTYQTKLIPDTDGNKHFRPKKIQDAVDSVSQSAGDGRGEVFTKNEVIEFILDLIEYSVDIDLSKARILEPSFGNGEFLIVIVERLFESYYKHGGTPINAVSDLLGSIRAVEIHQTNLDATKSKIMSYLIEQGISYNDSNVLCNRWLTKDDFLLAEVGNGFTHIVGNPPYIRQELIPDILMQEYRSRFRTIYDRADIYVPFIEKSLRLLASNGKLGFICSDRWMKNRYGGPLRKFISEMFHVKFYIDMFGTDAFHSDVTAYPAISVISKDKSKTTRIAIRPDIEERSLKSLAKALLASDFVDDQRIVEVHDAINGSEPWLFSLPKELALLRRIERAFPLIEDVGCKIGIGVATGRDKVFIDQMDNLDVEDDRKLPIVLAKDIKSGRIEWSGNVVLNPFEKNGSIIKLHKYPKLKAYFESNKDYLITRHVAKRNPSKWYRTIDKIDETLTKMPKLLIPDIKAKPLVAYDEGYFYPHHNLYWVTSNEWDLRALQSILLSSVTTFFICHYSVKMRGGCLRFQAQNLRRIRIPRWGDVPSALREQLISASYSRDLDKCDRLAFKLYDLSKKEEEIIYKIFNDY